MLHDGLTRHTAFLYGMVVLDRDQSCAEAQVVERLLRRHLLRVNPKAPAHWTRRGVREGELHAKGLLN